MTASATIALVLLLSFDTAFAAEYRTGQPVMGTILQVTVIADDADTARRASEAAIAEVKRWDDVLTIWREDGELARLNQAAGKGPVPISGRLHAALEQMIAFADQTEGAFDPAVGPLVALWSAGAIPSRDRLDRIAPVSIRTVLTLAAGRATLAAGAVLDPGAIGKGIGLDAAADVLRHAGVTAALLDFGGSSQTALAAPADSPQGWPIVIAGLANGEIHSVVALRDASLSTSRTRGADAEDGRILDPRSGDAVAEPRVATVRAPSATAADAWSTALVVLGRNGVAAAQRNRIDTFFEDAEGASETPGFKGISN